MEDLETQKQKLAEAEPGAHFNVTLDEKTYHGVKGDSNNQNILNIHHDGKLHGYIDFAREILVTSATNIIFKLSNMLVSIVQKEIEPKKDSTPPGDPQQSNYFYVKSC
jgi:hypothetical protein